MIKKKLTNRKKRAAATRQKIFNTAIKLFKKNGYKRVTVDDICNKAGVSKGAFYLYFKSKDMVILNQLVMSEKTFNEYMVKELNQHSSVVENLLLLGKKIISYTSELGIDSTQVLYGILINPNEKNASFISQTVQYHRLLEKLIEEGQAKGEITCDVSKDNIIQMFYYCGRGIVFHWCCLDGKFDLVKESEKMFNLIMKGLRPQ
ncbi:TetR/AcrR family transcriptional regulator [bacterium]|nr:MAG: TetR/AcrR family transcriptional regulator [bacterium]